MPERNRESKVALVLGAFGQDGHYLSRLLLSEGVKVVGTTRTPLKSSSASQNLPAGMAIAELDIRDSSRFEELLQSYRPNYVFNLAGFSHVGRSWDATEESEAVNWRAVEGLAQALLRFRDESSINPYFFHASSSEVFGGHTFGPQDEETNFMPVTPYGKHKVAAHEALSLLRSNEDLDVGIGIMFNHESPRRPQHFVSRRVSCGVAAIATGNASHLELGNLNAQRDWGFAGDYVRAMWLMAKSRARKDYVVATGTVRTVEDLVDAAFLSAGFNDWKSLVRTGKDLMRIVDPQSLFGDASRIKKDLGWVPEKKFEEMIAEMVASDVSLFEVG